MCVCVFKLNFIRLFYKLKKSSLSLHQIYFNTVYIILSIMLNEKDGNFVDVSLQLPYIRVDMSHE